MNASVSSCMRRLMDELHAQQEVAPTLDLSQSVTAVEYVLQTAASAWDAKTIQRCKRKTHALHHMQSLVCNDNCSDHITIAVLVDMSLHFCKALHVFLGDTALYWWP
eukprot:4833758-Amphidinium_carterae.1